MLSFFRSRIVLLVWLFIPTVLCSLFLHNLALCIDPFFFPTIEHRLRPRFAFFGRLLWVVLFAICLLLAWNIWPGTYLFFLHEALPFAPKYVLGALCFAIVLLVWFAVASEISRTFERWHVVTLSVAVILISVKVLAATGVIYAPFVRLYVKSPILGNAYQLLSGIGRHSRKVVVETPENTFNSFLKRQDPLPTHVVLMLVESWGERSATLATMARDIKGRGFQIAEYGFTSYKGSTLSGEFRELCSRYMQPSSGSMAEMGGFRCAPQYLSDKGYQIIGIHGYQSAFYARSTFWERFGIRKQIFADALSDQPRCPGPFPAVCDENLIRKGFDVLGDSVKPTFLYVLTLSSHEPIDPAALTHRGKYFNEIEVAHPTQIVTRRAISALVTRLEERSTSACTLVYITGDHQPPSASAQGNIFTVGKVPYLAFTQNCPAQPTSD
jgi:hypothetical protein